MEATQLRTISHNLDPNEAARQVQSALQEVERVDNSRLDVSPHVTNKLTWSLSISGDFEGQDASGPFGFFGFIGRCAEVPPVNGRDYSCYTWVADTKEYHGDRFETALRCFIANMRQLSPSR